MERFEFSTARDPHRNYCLWQYHPAAPAEDKFRAVNLLFHSFELAGADPRLYDMVDAIRDAIGPFRTVFGIKLIEGRLGWEYYFYDYGRREREVSISRLIAALRPFARCAIEPNESLPYFMFSIDVDSALARGERELDVVHMYLGNPGSTVSSGIAYALRPQGATLENFYFFFDAATQREDAASKIFCSPHVDPATVRPDAILLPELRDCHTICVANKQRNDCVYFSGVNVDQLQFFLERIGYPPQIRALVRDNRANLDHLLYDVGIDYRIAGEEMQVLKSGYYGVF
jgi:hypothetical protein